MTVAKRGARGELDLSSFGTVVFDECHHIAAPVMNLATRIFRARNVIGLTATKDRPDGLTPLLHWSLGPEGFRVERDAERVRVSMAIYNNSNKGGVEGQASGTQPLHPSQPLYSFPPSQPPHLPQSSYPPPNSSLSLMITRLAMDTRRNAFLADRVAYMRKQGRVVLVLSDRIAQLKVLKAMVVARGIDDADVGMFTGATKDLERQEGGWKDIYVDPPSLIPLPSLSQVCRSVQNVLVP